MTDNCDHRKQSSRSPQAKQADCAKPQSITILTTEANGRMRVRVDESVYLLEERQLALLYWGRTPADLGLLPIEDTQAVAPR